MKLLIFTLITLSFTLSHAGRIDNYYREVARTGALKPRPKPRTSSKTPIKLISTRKQKQFMKAISEAIEKKDARSLEVVESLLKKEPSNALMEVDAVTKETAIHIAAQSGNVRLVNLLLKYGANPNVRDFIGYTPLHMAETPAMARALIEAGANVNARENSLGYTPLHMAESAAMARTLIENGAKVSARDKDGETPLHTVRSPAVVRILIENGANVNARSAYDKTPLHTVRSPAMARALIEAGAKVSARDKDGETPLDTVRSPAVARILKQAMRSGKQF